MNGESGRLAIAARRNVLLLAGGMAALSGVVELVFGVATTTFEDNLVALVLFTTGLGWSLAFVAATAELSERAPTGQSATMIGFSPKPELRPAPPRSGGGIWPGSGGGRTSPPPT